MNDSLIHAPGDDEDLTKDEIIASLRQALKELKAGKGRPALEELDEIDREMSELIYPERAKYAAI